MKNTPRQRGPKIVKHALRIKWGVVDGGSPDICVSWGDRDAKPSARVAVHQMELLTDELTKRGWDITTLRFEIKRTPEWIAANPDAVDS